MVGGEGWDNRVKIRVLLGYLSKEYEQWQVFLSPMA